MPPKRIANDFDRSHTIPSKLKDVPYVYAQGGSESEVFRYFVLPDDMDVEVPAWTKTGKPTKKKMSAREFFQLPPEQQSPYVKISGVRDFRINRVAPKLSDKFGELLLTSTVGETGLPQMRLKYEIIKQYTNEELDEIERGLE